MALIKKTKRGFTTIPNEIINNPFLSLKAKGLWAYLNSKPDNWNFSVNGVKNQNKEGREAISSGMQELESARLLLRVPSKTQGGQFAGYDYHIYDYPCDSKTDNVKPVNGKPVEHSNKDLSNTIQSNTIEENDLFGNKPNPNKKTFFKNSLFFEIGIFKEKLKEAAALGVDVEYYHRAITNWNDIKTVKRTANGWIATARTWMEKDKDKGKLKMIDDSLDSNTDEEMKEYLSM